MRTNVEYCKSIDSIIRGYLIPYDMKGKSVAFLSVKKEVADILKIVSEELNFSVLILNPDDERHVQKRRLNEARSEFIFYTAECVETVWNLFNDGTTYLQEGFQVKN